MPPYTKRVLAQLIVRAWRAAAASPRRASSTSSERRVEAHAFKTRHGRKLLPGGGAREGMAAAGATGLPTAWKRTESPAAPRRCRCRRDARRCRWQRFVEGDERGGLTPRTRRSRPHMSDPTFVRGPGVDGISFTLRPGR